jgi:hypothetical protein
MAAFRLQFILRRAAPKDLRRIRDTAANENPSANSPEILRFAQDRLYGCASAWRSAMLGTTPLLSLS